MEGAGALESQHMWNPLNYLGIDKPLFYINAETVSATWIILIVMTALLLFLRWHLTKQDSLVRYITIQFIRAFKDLCTQTLGSFAYQHFALVTSLFLFILCCNWISLFPWIEEPTRDLNTTLALGFISFFYKEYQTIKTHGFGSYIGEFFHPFVLMFPLNVIGHFSKVISISFRLFGNIFGGSIIGQLYVNTIASSVIWEILGIITGMNLLMMVFFTLFEGFIQAFVFAMLTLTYLAIAIQDGEGE